MSAGSSLVREMRTLGALVVLLLVVCTVMDRANAQLSVGYYKRTCPTAEKVILAAVTANLVKDKTTAPGLLRMHFHDCFVNGCDGSILIRGSAAEESSPANTNLRESAFHTVNNAKTALEAVCPGVVSCADILTYAARDSVVLTRGLWWPVEGGRRDGLQSSIGDVPNKLPPPVFNLDQLTQLFQANGLSQDEMVTLSGGHSIGQAHCQAFANRINASNPDPTIDAKYAKQLAALCSGSDTSIEVNMEATPKKFDNVYYSELLRNRGLFTSDQVLANAAATRPAVLENANSQETFFNKFAKAMVHMGQIDVLTGSQGNIRRNCAVLNSQ